MSKHLNIIANILIKYYPPIGNIEHKYRTKVTAIGLLKTSNMLSQEFYRPYYDRLMSYKLLVKSLMENFRLSKKTTLKIFGDVVLCIINDEKISQAERYKSESLLGLMILLNPQFNEKAPEELYKYSKNFLVNLIQNKTAYQKVAEQIIYKYLCEDTHYDTLAQMIVRKCLTGIKQEEVLKRLVGAIYSFFVYAYFDPKKHHLRYEITFKHDKNLEHLAPFFNVKMLSRAISSKVGSYRTIVNFFGPRISNFKEIKNYFKKHQNIKVMFF